MRLPRVAIALALCALGCGDDPSPLAVAERLDPAACADCHPDHVREWSQSSHARAATDPIFLAMSRRGQRDTGGALGNFCIRCHAPAALLEGATTGDAAAGVTCFFCHAVEAVGADHNNGVVLGSGLTMRGPSRSIAVNDAHRSAYSPLLDGRLAASARMCGSCHDVVNQLGLRVERTFVEWQRSLYAGDSCNRCHMEASRPGHHDHRFAAVSLPLAGSPRAGDQRAAVAERLAGATQSALCVDGSRVRVGLQTRKVGHALPSGAAHNRRLWAEVIAYRGGQVIYQSGVVAPGQAVAGADPDLWLMRDCLFDERGRPVKMMWEAATHRSNALLPRVPVVQTYTLPEIPDRVTLRLRLRPVGLDVLDDLVQSGDLDPAVRDAMPVLDLDLGDGPVLEWTAGARECVTATQLDLALRKAKRARRGCD